MSIEAPATVQELVERSRAAAKAFEFATQEQADAAARAICKVVYDNAETLGTRAAVETRMGKISDKITKCTAKSSLIWASIKDKPTVGVIERDDEKHILKVAKPMGVVAAIIPSTNPVVTPMCNAADALKTRNSIIFAPHPRALQLTVDLAELFQDELEKLGLPRDLVLSLEKVALEDSQELMASADVVVATGGPAMVKSAYSSGKPSLGVGQGNVQCIVDTDADLTKAAQNIILGRSFDNGLICLGEQTAFAPAETLDAFLSAMEAAGGYLVTEPAEVNKLRAGLFPENGPINRHVVGLDAHGVGEVLDIDVPEDALAIVVKVDQIGTAEQLCREKLCPVIAVYPYNTFEEGVAGMVENLEFEGKGHSIAIHSNTPEHVEHAAIQCAVSSVVVNQPAGSTGGGSPTNGFDAPTTLGCGSWGNNSFSGNFNYTHLMNITRVGFPLEQAWLESPEAAWK